MPIVCQRCGDDAGLSVGEGGKAAECLACQNRFAASLPVARPVHRSGQRPPAHDRANEELIRHAKTECTVAGGGLIALGALSVFTGLGVAISGWMFVSGGSASGQALPGLSHTQTGFLYLTGGLYGMAAAVFQMYAGRQMQLAKQYGLCLIACVLAVVPGVSFTCVVGLIFGGMGLLKLTNPQVRQGFAANRPDYDPDRN